MGWGTGNIGGSSGGLNFKVVGNPQPANPKENTIWLNTDVDITGYYFQAEQPEMQPGEVWISTGKASQVAFNVLKKGTVMVYPLAAKQMLEDGTLVDVTAKIWQDGEWVELINLLDLTSGWIQAAQAHSWVNGSVTCGSRLTITNDDYDRLAAATKEDKIDFADIKSVTIIIDDDSTGLTNGRNWLAVISSTGFRWDPGLGGVGAPSNVVASIEFKQPGEITLDTSNIQGQYYLSILATAQKTVYCSRVSYLNEVSK